MWVLLAVVWVAFAGPSPTAYDTATRLIDRLYLERDEVDEVRLLRAAALRLEEEVHWLHVSFEGAEVHLTHGDGRALGKVRASSMADLPRALRALVSLVEAQGRHGGSEPGMAVLAGLGDALDPYSKLLTEERLERFNFRLTGLQVGVGAAVVVEHGRASVAAIHPGGPADRAGLRPGDEVLRVDGQPTGSMRLAELEARLRGTEGSRVVLDVVRIEAAADADPERLVLTRAPVVVPNVSHDVLEGSVGYVRIDHVSQRTVENLRASLGQLRSLGALEQGLVLDLRHNTGGSMRESARLADVFLSEGLVLRTVGRNGQPVRNLDREISATAQPDDLDVPVVVVVDERTASGAEILAGALAEHDRAVLVGTRTYGKGTVQKSLPLDRGAHLKLTIARYELAHGRQIQGIGLVPDVAIGTISLGASGASAAGFGQGDAGDAWAGVVPSVEEAHSWRGRARRMDLPVELARRALLDVEGPSRAPLLAAVRRHARAARVEQEAHLVSALGAHGTDWTVDASALPTTALVKVWAEPRGAGTYAVHATVQNTGRHDLMRAAVHLDCPMVPELDGEVLLVGRVPPGAERRGTRLVELPAGLDREVAEAELSLWAHQQAVRSAGTARLVLQTPPVPDVSVEARLRPGSGTTGAHGLPVREVELQVHNLSSEPVAGLRAELSLPGVGFPHAPVAEGVLVPAEGSALLVVPVEVQAGAGRLLPMELTLSAGELARIARWSADLPSQGARVVLQAPRMEVRTPSTATAGEVVLPISVRDDRQLDHVVVWVNGAKAAWSGGGGNRVSLRPRIWLEPGVNEIFIEAVDGQGLRARRRITMWADETAVDEAPAG